MDITIEEVNTGKTSIPIVGSTGTAYIGIFERGEIGKPVLCNNESFFNRKFGGSPLANTYSWYGVRGDYQNRGRGNVWVMRIGHYTDISDPSTLTAVKATLTLLTADSDSVIRIDAVDEGEWGNDYQIKIVAGSDTDLYTLQVIKNDSVVSEYIDVSNDPTHYNYVVNAINRKDYNIRVTHLDTDNTDPCKVITATNLADGEYNSDDIDSTDIIGNAGAKTGMYAFSGLVDIFQVQLIACLDSGTFLEAEQKLIDQAIIDFANVKFPKLHAIVGMPKDKDYNLEDAVDYVRGLGRRSKNASMYYPWLKVENPLSIDRSNPFIAIPPMGHVCGVIARTDNNQGVWIAAAGTEATLNGVYEPNVEVTDEDKDVMRSVGVNAIMYQDGNLCIWGARTLSDDPKWLEQPMRRFFNLVESGIIQQKFLVFKPIKPSTFEDIESSLDLFLKGFWEKGAMGGDQINPSDSYYTKCDTDINTAVEETNREIVADAGIRGLHFAEKIKFRIRQFDGGDFDVEER